MEDSHSGWSALGRHRAAVESELFGSRLPVIRRRVYIRAEAQNTCSPERLSSLDVLRPSVNRSVRNRSAPLRYSRRYPWLWKETDPSTAPLVRWKTIVLADDPVAADATCARLMGFEPDRIAHIREGSRFLGNSSPKLLHQIVEVPLPRTAPFLLFQSFNIFTQCDVRQSRVFPKTGVCVRGTTFTSLITGCDLNRGLLRPR